MKRYKVWDPLVRIFHWSVAVAFALNALVIDEDADLHLWLGYAVFALVSVRMIWGLAGPRRARFADFLPAPRAVLGQLADIATDRRRVSLGHSPLGALMVFNLLASLAVIAVSGHLMTTDALWGVAWVEELHEASVTWAELSVVVHIIAVIWESRRTGVNLPRAMVTGVKAVPKDATLMP